VPEGWLGRPRLRAFAEEYGPPQWKAVLPKIRLGVLIGLALDLAQVLSKPSTETHDGKYHI
jgi:hypothetical protein